jgi:hypothetical protein
MISVSDPSVLEEVNAELEGENVTMQLLDGREVKCTGVHVGLDETSWADRSSGERWSAPTGKISSIKLKKGSRGVLKGLLFGGGATTAMATGMYLASSDEPYSELVFFVLPPLGILFGMIGGGQTDADVYEIELAGAGAEGQAHGPPEFPSGITAAPDTASTIQPSGDLDSFWKHQMEEREFYASTIRFFIGEGNYDMADFWDTYQAMNHMTPYPHETRRGPGKATEFSATFEFRAGEHWTIGLGGALLADDFLVCWDQPGGWFGGGLHCGPELKANCRTLQISVTHSLLWSRGWFRPYARFGVGRGWADIEGVGDSVTITADASGALFEASAGIDLTRLSGFDLTFEIGVRSLEVGVDDGESQGVASSGMDDEILRFLDGGSADFSGSFFRIGLTFRGGKKTESRRRPTGNGPRPE